MHLIDTQGTGPDIASEAFDHVGIHLENYGAFRSKIDDLRVPYSTMDLPEINERRLFFRTPSGPLLEAVFTEPTPTERLIQ